MIFIPCRSRVNCISVDILTSERRMDGRCPTIDQLPVEHRVVEMFPNTTFCSVLSQTFVKQITITSLVVRLIVKLLTLSRLKMLQSERGEIFFHTLLPGFQEWMP